MPAGGLNFVDARDVAALLPVAMERGRRASATCWARYNWTFAEFFGRLERLTKIAAPELKTRGRASRHRGARAGGGVSKMGRKVPVEPESVDMAQYFWYLDAGKAARELGFAAARSRRHAARHRQLRPRAVLGNGRVQEGRRLAPSGPLSPWERVRREGPPGPLSPWERVRAEGPSVPLPMGEG